ncbi:transposase [Oceanobacter sp. 5_MG-2023]
MPPEPLLRTLLLKILFSIRSERQLVEQIHHSLI